MKFDAYAKPDEEAFFWSNELQKICGKPAVYKQGKHFSRKKTQRQEIAEKEAEKEPESIDRIINLTNCILSLGGMSEVKEPLISGPELAGLLCGNTEFYKQIFRIPRADQLVWMKFTSDGHLGVVAAGSDINFDKTNNSYKIINSCGLEWDESFVLAFPLYSNTNELDWDYISKIETVVGNYLIQNGVPIIDKYSHNY